MCVCVCVCTYTCDFKKNDAQFRVHKLADLVTFPING